MLSSIGQILLMIMVFLLKGIDKECTGNGKSKKHLMM